MKHDNDEIVYMGGNTAADLKERVRSIAGLAKVEKQLKARTKEVSTQIKEAYKKAQSAGHDPGILKKVVKEALLTVEERLELYDNEERVDQVVEATRKALGLLDGDNGDALGIEEEAAARAEPFADVLKGNDVVEDVAVMDRGGKGRGKR